MKYFKDIYDLCKGFITTIIIYGILLGIVIIPILFIESFNSNNKDNASENSENKSSKIIIAKENKISS
jgi:hypothetical protein